MHKIIITIILLLIGYNIKAQQLDKSYILKIVKNAVSVLRDNKDSTTIAKKIAYESLINNFCYAKEYKEDVQKIISEDDLFQLIEANKEISSNAYIRGFLLYRSGCFSKEEYAYVRKTLSSILTPSSEDFYELVGLFNLYNFKEYIELRVDSTWFNKFSESLNTGFLSEKLIREALPYIALANLGNKKIESKIIGILLNHSKTFNTLSPDQKEISNQYFFYQRVLGNILSKLYSKNSITATMSLLDNYLNWMDFVKVSDVSSSPMNFVYIENVLSGKLEPVYSDSFIHNIFFSLSEYDIEIRKAAITKLKSDIINDKIKWSNLYEYRK